MMVVRYHRCTCHQRYSQQQAAAANSYNVANGNGTGGGGGNSDGSDNEDDDSEKSEEPSKQPWYFHVVASAILVVHGLTFLVPHDSESEDTDMVRTVAGWLGYEMDWVKHFTPYAQVRRRTQYNKLFIHICVRTSSVQNGFY